MDKTFFNYFIKGVSVCLAVIVIYIGLCSYYNFDTSWDYLAYHLPHILRIANLTTFVEAEKLIEVNRGFPALPHVIQSILVLVTGRFSSTNLLNYLALLFFLLYARKRLKINSIGFLILGFLTLSVPAVLIQLTHSYIDLWSNILIALALCEAVFFHKSEDKFDVKNTAFFIALITFAIFSKYQMWPAAILALFVFYSRRYKIFEVQFKKMFFSVVVVGLLFSIWPVRNIIYFNNPVYPVQSPIFKEHFNNVRLDPKSHLQVPKYLESYPSTVKFLASVFEISRWLSSEPLEWTIDQGHQGGIESPHHRMGGWSLVTMFTVFLLILAIFQKNKSAVSWFILIFLGTSFFPQSHELRYWLYLPIFGIVVAALGLESIHGKYYWKAAVLCFIIANFSYVLLKLRPRINRQPPESYAPKEAIDFWDKARQNDPNRQYLICKMPLTIFYSGKKFNEFRVQECPIE